MKCWFSPILGIHREILMPHKTNGSPLGNQCASAPVMRKEFAEWILHGEHLVPAEIRYFIKCMRMEVERQREQMTDKERSCAEECEFSLAHMERELERAWNKTLLKLAEKVYEDKATRLRFLNQETA